MNWTRKCAAASLIPLTLLMGCAAVNEANQNSAAAVPGYTVKSPSAPSSPVPFASGMPAIKSAAPSSVPSALPAASKSVFSDGKVPDYNGSGRGYTIDGSDVNAKLLSDSLTPIAVFVPETMAEFQMGKSKAWGTPDHRNYVVFHPGGLTVRTEEREPVLLLYKEYKGTVKDGNTSADYFAFSVHGKPYTAEVRLTLAEREALLPLFTQMVGSAQYLEKRQLPEPGVYVARPKLSGEGQKQMVDAVMDCLKGWAGNDRKLFNSAMYSPETADYFSYLFSPDVKFRFSSLTYEGQPKDTKRVDFLLEYQAMHDNGYLSEGIYTISLLKNKQGEWKVAQID
ncbi:hypothetical protein KIH86_16165 [Paenibacillus sp. HN-1]|uniref:hypothetical protein n=1 Tax=Paenibacillus TaxID=44249 RepID=UPI001CA99AA8|nr:MULTISPECIES: hypothetical protein [Paenibacillus]MBY9082102.1 hypothetical protein [Paenibacillus sp. CGMCC 1.18879]MBY9085740.1 hypothetical protein [Paenibacillus sinensis]